MATVKPKDKEFGAKVVELGYLSEGELKVAFQELSDAHQSSVGLRDLLEQKGTLTKEKSRAVERALSGGQQIAGYELLEKVGQGGMGAVFRARQISMDRIVALKILPPKLAKDKKFCERFIMEARASGGLNHINIIQGIDVGESQGHYYFAMEYVDGCTVKNLIDDHGRLPEAMALLICRQMADALDHANQNKLVHRDIKPDNIMLAGLPEDWEELSSQGKLNITAKLCDLGLARSVEGGADDMKGVAVGTPHFIAPEQARGETDVDTRADIYSLGASLYNMLTAKTLFSGKSSRDVMMLHLTDQAPDPNSIEGVNVGENTLRIMEKMLAKDRTDRYENPKQLAEDLLLAIGGKKPVYTKGFNARSSLALPAKLRKGESTGSVRAVRSGRTTTVSGRHTSVRGSSASEPPASGVNLKLIVGGGLGVLALGALGIFFATRGGDDGTPKPSHPVAQLPSDSGDGPSHQTPTHQQSTNPSNDNPSPDDGGSKSPPPVTNEREHALQVAQATFKKVMDGLGDDPGKNVAALREANGDVRVSAELSKQLDDRLGQELEKWRVALTTDWKGGGQKAIDGLIKQQKFESARKLLAGADPKFQEIQKELADTGKFIDDKEKESVDTEFGAAGNLVKAKHYPDALALLDPEKKGEYSDAQRKRFGTEQAQLQAEYHQFQILDAAQNIDQHEQLFEKVWQTLGPIASDAKNYNRLHELHKAVRSEQGKKENLAVLDWINQDRADLEQARALVKAAEDALNKNLQLAIFRLSDDGKAISTHAKSVKDGKIIFQDTPGEYPLETALGSTQVARLAGALDKDAPPAKVLGAAMLAMVVGEFDKAEALLRPLPTQATAEAFRRLAILSKQPDDEKLVRRQLDTITLLLEAGKSDDAAKKFDEVDTAQSTTPIGLKYASRFLQLRTAVRNKGFATGGAQAAPAPAPAAPAPAPAAPAPPPPPPPPPAKNTDNGGGSTTKVALNPNPGVECSYIENVDGLPNVPNLGKLPATGMVTVKDINFDGKVGNVSIKDNFVIRMRGSLQLVGGRYQFRLQCDDGGRLTVWEDKNFKNHVKSEDWSSHPMHATDAGGIDLPAGLQHFSIEYFNANGGSGLKFEWIPPGKKDWELVPAEVLGH